MEVAVSISFIGPIPVARPRFEVERLCRLGPWQIRENLPESAHRIIATCPDEEIADAIARFMNGDPQGAYSDLQRFRMIGEEENA
jgi:hypothetical protein